MNCTMLVVLAALSCQQTVNPAEKAGLARINAVRQSVGLEPVRLDLALSKGCTAHAQYMIRNFTQHPTGVISLNAEEPQRPGYTEAGLKAAQIGWVRPGQAPVAAVDWTMATFLGRLTLLRPELRRVGIGVARDARKHPLTVLDYTRGRSGDRLILYPADKQKDVPLAWVGPEDPSPLPKEATQPGFPVTVTFPLYNKVENVTAVLKDAAGKEVACWLSTPQRPAINPGQQFNTICLIPKDWLQADMAHTVAVTAQVNGIAWKQTWAFETGSRVKPGRDAAKPPIDVINAYRQQAGLDPVILDAGYTEGCLAHAEYLVKNIEDVVARKTSDRDEDPKRPGYTAAGRKAGQAALSFTAEPTALIDSWMAGFNRRLRVLHPDLQRVGIGYAKGKDVPHLTVLDVSRGREQTDVIVYPPDKLKGVPLLYAATNPDLLGDARDKRAGYPITVFFPPSMPVKDATATLHDSAGKAVSARVFTPQDTTLKPEYHGNNVCLIPRDPLKGNSTYTVSVQARYGDEAWTKKWSFTTAPR